MKAYIQRLNGEIPDDWVWSAMNGLRNKGFDIRYFEEEDIARIPCTGNEVVVAYIEPTIKYFQLNGIKVPKPLNIPEALNDAMFLYRRIQYLDVGEFKQFTKESDLPVFIKPDSRLKEFSSGLLSSLSMIPFVLNGISDDSVMLVSDPVEIVSEWRCFVHDGKLQAIQNYSGDFRVFPMPGVIEMMIARYKDAPISYSLDVGVIFHDDKYFKDARLHRTVLIECNDMWSIGHYGLRDQIYSTMLRDRWFEIIRSGLQRN